MRKELVKEISLDSIEYSVLLEHGDYEIYIPKESLVVELYEKADSIQMVMKKSNRFDYDLNLRSTFMLQMIDKLANNDSMDIYNWTCCDTVFKLSHFQRREYLFSGVDSSFMVYGEGILLKMMSGGQVSIKKNDKFLRTVRKYLIEESDVRYYDSALRFGFYDLGGNEVIRFTPFETMIID